MTRPDLHRLLNHQESIVHALSSRSQEELVHIAADLMKTYVIDGAAPLKVDVGRVHVPQSLRGLPFSALIETLKFHLDLRELEQFTVSDGQVFVKLGDREFALDGNPPPRQAPPAGGGSSAAAPSAPRSTPAASRPSGNSLFGGDTSGARPSARPGAPVESPPSVRESPLRPEIAPRPEAPRESDDRFRMLELD